MPVEQINYTRGGKAKTLEIGVDPTTGKSHYKEETVEPEGPFVQRTRSSVVRIVLEFDQTELNGELLKIETTHAYGRLSENGLLQPETIKEYPSPMQTRESDRRGFAIMHESILKGVANGKVEAMDGFNGKKIFDPLTGALLTYTEAQENEPPTGDYYAPEPTEPA